MVFEIRKKVKGTLQRHFKQLLIPSIKSSCFLFDDVYYKLINGISMDSTWQPILANLF